MPSLDSEPDDARGFSVRLCGALSLMVGGRERAGELSLFAGFLLALLLLDGPAPQPRHQLAQTLWPEYDDSPEAQKKRDANFRQQFGKLRKALGDAEGRLVESAQGVRLETAGADIDVLGLKDGLRQANFGRVSALENALLLTRAPLLPGCDEPWIDGHRESLRRRRIDALLKLARLADERAGNHSQAVGWLEEALALDPQNVLALRHRLALSLQVGGIAESIALAERLLKDTGPLIARELDPVLDRLRRLAEPRKSVLAPLVTAIPPVPRTRLLGRDALLDYVTPIVLHQRIVTLRGPGGIGKTRLSLAILHRLRDTFLDGAAFVDLASLAAGANVESVAAQVARSVSSRAPNLAAFVREMENRSVLFVLDNAEHVLESVRTVARELLKCPEVHLLATSREPLRVTGERLCPVPALKPSDASRMFLNRAPLAFPPDDPDEIDAVDRICQLVEHNPLGIELAAATVERFDTLARLSDKMTASFALLERADGDDDAPDRTRTLDNAIRWSYDLLESDSARAFFRSLSPLLGGGDLPAHTALSQTDLTDAVDLTNRLIRSSLMQVMVEDDDANPVRWRYPEPVRDFAFRELSALGEGEGAIGRHIAHFTRVMDESSAHQGDPDAEAWVEGAERERANIEAALTRSLDRAANDPALVADALHLAGSLTFLWYLRGNLTTAVNLLSHSLKLPGALADAPTVRRGRMEAGFGLATVLYISGSFEEITDILDETLALSRSLADTHFEARILGTRGLMEMENKNYAVAEQIFLEVEVRFLALNDPYRAARARDNYSLVAASAGNYKEAVRRYGQSIPRLRELRLRLPLAVALNSHADLLREIGEFEQARSVLTESIALCLELQHWFALIRGLFLVCEVQVSVGDWKTLAVILGAAKQLSEVRGFPFSAYRANQETEIRSVLVDQLGETVLETRVKEGRALSIQSVVARTLELIQPGSKSE